MHMINIILTILITRILSRRHGLRIIPETITFIGEMPDRMTQQDAIQLFEERKVRTAWDDQRQEWYFSVVDVVGVLTDSADPKQYIKKMRSRDPELNAKWGTICTPIAMLAPDGKKRATLAADTEGLFRLIQSIPSPKAEPFKLWLAQIAAERLDEMQDPELTIDRAMLEYKQLGYSDTWINQRLKSIEVRKELTEEWKRCGLEEGRQFAVLTNIITQVWSDRTVREYKALKGLRKENLRDHMTNTELILNMLAEASAKDISEATDPETFEEQAEAAHKGGSVARAARLKLERSTGRKVVTGLNAKGIRRLKSRHEEEE